MTAPAHAALAPHEERFVAGFRDLAERARGEDPERGRRRLAAPVAVAVERALARHEPTTVVTAEPVVSPVDVFRADPLSAPFVVLPEHAAFYSEVTQEINGPRWANKTGSEC